ncbi:MAG: methylmalonyl-CoA mutase family protein [Myxococcota bacterium]
MTTAAQALSPASRSEGPPRIVTAAALFDGHDAAINIMRRLLQKLGVEVVHLGHDRSVEDIATAAVQEDAHAVAVSSYQGGHVEFFGYLLDRLRELGAEHVRVYGGGGGVIAADEIERLHARGVARIFTPEDGQRLGLEGMIRELLRDCGPRPPVDPSEELAQLGVDRPRAVARLISWLEAFGDEPAGDVVSVREELEQRAARRRAPVVGLTGPGGAGKSNLMDELVRRYRHEHPRRHVAIVSVDPTRRRSGGALLGDRLRMNALTAPHVFMRSLATRRAHLALSRAVTDTLRVYRAAGFDLVLVETAGIGQSDSEVTELADVSLYVMTPEYGAPSQLEKIDMLELADLIVLNKFDRQGGEDALRDVRKQWRRNHGRFDGSDEGLPVFPTVASRWNDAGTDALYAGLMARLAELGGAERSRHEPPLAAVPDRRPLVPPERARYLAEIAQTLRSYREGTRRQAERAADAEALRRALDLLESEPPARELQERYTEALEALEPELRDALERWPETRRRYEAPTQVYRVRERDVRVENHVRSLAGLDVPRVALPRAESWPELIRYLREENLPGHFPFTSGVFPFMRRGEEDPARMFAGEGTPERTNRRFHLLCRDQPAARLSTAFDSVTLYGRDPDERPDIYGKVGTSGVSVCTVDDAKKLYSGFDLGAPATSVSMTINGPAPVLLACFLNATIDQAVEKHLLETGRMEAVRARFAGRDLPRYAGKLPKGNDGLGLRLLGVSGDEVVDAETYARIRTAVLADVRGTVQADILKEDQAQNTCIFSTDFSLRLMGDIQDYFCTNGVRNFYSVSISGYHMAEAGANPITQLAFTLANGFTYVEYYLSRGLPIDAFAPSFSFFFSNGLDPEYAVIGRVARRIWAIAMRERYGASERSQRLKYHIQTSGRSLHAQEMAFNDIRTTLQALLALQDHCNSLHTNAYDEAVTTPTEESVRRALAIQLILMREFGLLQNENPLQGSFIIRELTDLVEDAVLTEFERLSERGGVLGAMETLYQRSRIQEESLLYESRKHSGELPIIGVNTFRRPDGTSEPPPSRALVRASEEERRAQLRNLRAFQARHAAASPAALERLCRTAQSRGNVFAELMETVKVASLGQICDALFGVGGRYRRAM